MSAQRSGVFALLTVLGLALPLHAAPPDRVRSAAVKGLVLIRKSAATYTTQRQCFSCHHQALPLLALSTGKTHGLDVSEDGLRKQVRFVSESLAKNREDYLKGRGQGGQVDTAGYALWALELGGHKADATTAAVVKYLLLRDKDHDSWRTTSRRPPSEASPFTTTYLAVRGLRKFGPPEQQQAIDDRIDRVRGWLQTTPAVDTEDRVFRFWAMQIAGVKDKELKTARQELLRGQRADGGWAQTGELESDAYATGSALVVLHQAGSLATSDSVYKRGLKFLVGTQQDDGSWLVRSRSKPFQTYFESGFPHGKDQFISIAASSWATTALALACPPAAEAPERAKQ